MEKVGGKQLAHVNVVFSTRSPLLLTNVNYKLSIRAVQCVSKYAETSLLTWS